MRLQIPELVVPAGDLECFRTACSHGADAVYLGTGKFNMRAKAKNFDLCELDEALSIAAQAGVKVYVTMNSLLQESDLEGFKEQVAQILERKPHAFIISDPAALRIIRKIAPEQRLHLSTQASVSNPESAAFWFKQGLSRINLAREVPGAALSAFRDKVPELETEVFVHGSMCIAVSGHCLLSSALSARSANRGACAQTCRWGWSLVEKKRPGEYFPIEETEEGTAILGSQDLCLAREIPSIARAGVAALKIEGRMKSPHYVAVVTKTYREILDTLKKDGEGFVYRDSWDDALRDITHRPYGKGFWDGVPSDGTTQKEGYQTGSRFLGRIEALGETPNLGLMVARHHLVCGDRLALRNPKGADLVCKLRAIRSYSGHVRERARSGDLIWIEADQPLIVGAVLVAPKPSDPQKV